jgi:hypothetical protein
MVNACNKIPARDTEESTWLNRTTSPVSIVNSRKHSLMSSRRRANSFCLGALSCTRRETGCAPIKVLSSGSMKLPCLGPRPEHGRVWASLEGPWLQGPVALRGESGSPPRKTGLKLPPLGHAIIPCYVNPKPDEIWERTELEQTLAAWNSAEGNLSAHSSLRRISSNRYDALKLPKRSMRFCANHRSHISDGSDRRFYSNSTSGHHRAGTIRGRRINVTAHPKESVAAKDGTFPSNETHTIRDRERELRLARDVSPHVT